MTRDGQQFENLDYSNRFTLINWLSAFNLNNTRIFVYLTMVQILSIIKSYCKVVFLSFSFSYVCVYWKFLYQLCTQ